MYFIKQLIKKFNVKNKYLINLINNYLINLINKYLINY